MSKQQSYDATDSNESFKSPKSNEVTYIPYGCEIRGALLVLNDACRIDGRFFGTIISKDKIILGEKAVVCGDLICENADIYGTMEGNLTVGEILSFMNTAVFNGDLKVQRLCVEDGAKFDGKCNIISKENYTKLFSEFQDKANKEFPQTATLSERKAKGEKIKVEFSSDAQNAI